jgi:hypothetical protein
MHTRRGKSAAGAPALAVAALLALAISGCASDPAATPGSTSSGSGQLQQLPNAAAQTTSKPKSTSGAPSSMEEVAAQNAATTLDSTSTGHGQIVLFDVAHSEIFGPKNTSDLGQSAAVARMRTAGLRVVATHTPFTSAMLRGVSGVIISGNMQPLAADELTALEQFVTRGGIVLVTVHIAPLDQNIGQLFGFGFSPGVLQTSNPAVGEDPVNLTCTTIEKSVLTQNVHAVKVLGAWALAPRPPSTIVVGTGADVFLDMDKSGTLTSADMKGPFGMVGERQMGKGVLIMSGDDAVFANIALASKDNMQLFDNVVAAMKTAP